MGIDVVSNSGRFTGPVLFSAMGIALTIVGVTYWALRFNAAKPLYDLVQIVPGKVPADAAVLLFAFLPIYVIVFLVLIIPIASLMLFFNRLLKAASFTQSIMKIGEKFSGRAMIKRAIMPALFSLSFGELILSLVPGWMFNDPGTVSGSGSLVIEAVSPLMTTLGALIVLPVALAFYAPTWLLNDAGIISHLRPALLENRRPPDTEGVGRWYSSFISGFAMFGFPVSMAYRYFYQAYFVMDVPIVPLSVFLSVFWTIGLPLLVVSFVLPIVMLNEVLLGRTSRAVRRVARLMGAQDVGLEQMKAPEQQAPP